MLPRLALLFIVIPILELALLVKLGQLFGFWPTLGLVLGTGVVGAALARSAGLRVALSIRSELAAGRVPSGALLDGLAILVGGAFLLAPGLITDVVGLSLLFTPTRRWIQGHVRAWIDRQILSGQVRVGTMSAQGWGFQGGPQRPPDLDPRKEIEMRRPDA